MNDTWSSSVVARFVPDTSVDPSSVSLSDVLEPESEVSESPKRARNLLIPSIFAAPALELELEESSESVSDSSGTRC